MNLQPNQNLSGMVGNGQEKNLAGSVSIATITLPWIGYEKVISLGTVTQGAHGVL